MLLLKTYPLKFIFAVWFVLSLSTACTSAEMIAPATATSPPLGSAAPTILCEQVLVPAEINEIQPSEPTPGSEIKIIGTGGYMQDTCDGYIESAKLFRLYLDQESVGNLSCYVNYCEGKLILPGDVSSEVHCLSVEKDRCQFEFQVTD